MVDLTGGLTQDLLTALRQRVPPDLAQRAAAFRPGQDQPAPVRDAATVALVRDCAGGAGVEVCLLRRVSTMAFAAGMHVFPGGTVDPADARSRPRWFGDPEEETARALGADVASAGALVCAAVRETFEECGVLLAGPDADTVADVTDPSWESDRQALEGRLLSMASLLGRRGLGLRVDLLGPWARWVTPEIEPRRYDTRFFVAALPSEQRARPIPGESDRMLWITPQAALAATLAGQLPMLPPTVHTLMEIAEHDTAAAVLAAARGRDTRPVQPKIVIVGGQARLLFPDDDGYDQTPGHPVAQA